MDLDGSLWLCENSENVQLSLFSSRSKSSLHCFLILLREDEAEVAALGVWVIVDCLCAGRLPELARGLQAAGGVGGTGREQEGM